MLAQWYNYIKYGVYIAVDGYKLYAEKAFDTVAWVEIGDLRTIIFSM